MIAATIKNLLFDLGGVIVDLERERCLNSLVSLGMTAADADNMVGLYIQAGPFQQLEHGDIDTPEFRDIIRKTLPHEVTDEEIDQAFSNFIVGIPVHRLRAIERLRGKYRTYVISNTNPIMFDGVLAREFAKDGKDINAYFHGVTVSYLAHSTKPEREIFDYAVRTMGIMPKETLLLDDGQKNIDAARALGFNAVLVPPGTEFTQILEELGL